MNYDIVFLILITLLLANIITFSITTLLFVKVGNLGDCTSSNCVSDDCTLRECINGKCKVKYVVENCCSGEDCLDCNFTESDTTYFLLNRIETNDIIPRDCDGDGLYVQETIIFEDNIISSCFISSNVSQDKCNSTFNNITISENAYANIIQFYDQYQEFINLNNLLIPQNDSLPAYFNGTLSSILTSKNINISQILYTNYITPCENNDKIRLLKDIIIYGNGTISLGNINITNLLYLANLTSVNIRKDLLVNGILLQNSTFQGFRDSVNTTTHQGSSYTNIIINNLGGNVGFGQLDTNSSLENELTIKGTLGTSSVIFSGDSFDQTRNISACNTNITNCNLNWYSIYEGTTRIYGFYSSGHVDANIKLVRMGKTVFFTLFGNNGYVSTPVSLNSTLNVDSSPSIPNGVYFTTTSQFSVGVMRVPALNLVFYTIIEFENSKMTITFDPFISEIVLINRQVFWDTFTIHWMLF